MSDSLVERLRSLTHGRQTSIEAADRIEALEEELSIWKSVFPDIAPERVLPDRSLLEAENERLRAALQDIAQSGPVDSEGNHDPEAGWAWCYERALEALAPPKDG